MLARKGLLPLEPLRQLYIKILIVKPCSHKEK
jgi:hypothetical protein